MARPPVRRVLARLIVAQATILTIGLCALHFAGYGITPGELWDLLRQAPPSPILLPDAP